MLFNRVTAKDDMLWIALAAKEFFLAHAKDVDFLSEDVCAAPSTFHSAYLFHIHAYQVLQAPIKTYLESVVCPCGTDLTQFARIACLLY